jgi:hypothetical protein
VAVATTATPSGLTPNGLGKIPTDLGRWTPPARANGWAVATGVTAVAAIIGIGALLATRRRAVVRRRRSSRAS